DGSVWAQYLGKVVLAGLTYGRAREILLARYRKIVSKCSELEIFMGSSQRSISVNIFGEVKQAGSYRINAATPAFNALFEAGGVTPIGSVRNIEIRRGGKVVKTLDLYKILIQGDLNPIYLQDNDILFVGIQGKIVNINGQVKRPMRYELKEGENLRELIDYAGGLNAQALRSSARMIRPDEERPIQVDFVLDSYLSDDAPVYPIEDGDVIQIRAKKDNTQNTARIVGPVAFPDLYQLKDGDRVSDLIQQAGGLEDEAFLPRAYVVRTDPMTAYVSYLKIDLSKLEDPSNDIELQFNDVVQVFSEKNFQETREIQISGKVNQPGSVRLSREMTLKDLLYQAGGLIEGKYIQEVELYRQFNPLERGINNLGSGEEEIVRIPIPRDWQESPLTDSLKMWEFRRVIIRSEDEFIRQGEVEIKGLVNNPGTYPVLPDMSLKDLIYLAGGFKIEADYENIELSRVIDALDDNQEIVPIPIVIQRISTTQNWREDPTLEEVKINIFDQIFVRPNPDFLLQESVAILGEVRVAGEYNKIAKNERMSSLVSRSGGITELAYLKGAVLDRRDVGLISIQLDQALRNPGSKWDITLQAGDQLLIPPRLDVVTITGNVLESGVKVVHEPGIRRLRYYVKQAGGFDRKTDKKKVSVRYVNGRVKSARRFLGFTFFPKVEQGSVINVARKKEKESKEKKEREPVNVQEALSGVTAILTLFLLLDRTLSN
ncbi:MAG: SLBB domain-containing protein, partial [Bacteroidota bacterium]